MKTVSGSVISSKPISLSKAASVLSIFISAETGASQAVSAYLKRASASFNEIVQINRELNAGRSERKHKKIRLEMVDEGNLTDAETCPREDRLAVERGRILDLGEEQSYRYRGNSEGEGFDDSGTNSRRNKKKERDFSDYGSETKGRNGGGGLGIGEEKRKERKKRKKEEVEDGELDDAEDRHGRRSNKRRRGEGDN